MIPGDVAASRETGLSERFRGEVFERVVVK